MMRAVTIRPSILQNLSAKVRLRVATPSDSMVCKVKSWLSHFKRLARLPRDRGRVLHFCQGQRLKRLRVPAPDHKRLLFERILLLHRLAGRTAYTFPVASCTFRAGTCASQTFGNQLHGLDSGSTQACRGQRQVAQL
jgi:hypothetical protein